MKEIKELNLSQIYDSEDDICYFSFGTGEPSYVEDVSDEILIELGIFTNMPTGFRILNFKKLASKIKAEAEMRKKIRKTIDLIRKEYPADLANREKQVTTALQKALG
jgi:hypothetical protein